MVGINILIEGVASLAPIVTPFSNSFLPELVGFSASTSILIFDRGIQTLFNSVFIPALTRTVFTPVFISIQLGYLEFKSLETVSALAYFDSKLYFSHPIIISMEAHELLEIKKLWDQRVIEVENRILQERRNLAYCLEQQARIIGELASQNVYLIPCPERYIESDSVPPASG